MSVLERLLIFVLVVWGATNIVAGSKLVKPLRDRLSQVSPKLGEMSNCYMCIGFWIGCAVSLCGFNIAKSISPILDPVIDGFIGSGTIWGIFVVLERLGAESL